MGNTYPKVDTLLSKEYIVCCYHGFQGNGGYFTEIFLFLVRSTSVCGANSLFAWQIVLIEMPQGLSLGARQDLIRIYHKTECMAEAISQCQLLGWNITRSAAKNAVAQYNRRGVLDPGVLKKRKGVAGMSSCQLKKILDLPNKNGHYLKMNLHMNLKKSHVFLI